MGTLALRPEAPQLAPAGAPPSLTLLAQNVARVLAEHPDRQLVLGQCRQALALLTPASPEAFGRSFERLALHYPEGTLTPPEHRVIFADWRRLLADTPEDVFDGAIDAYLLTPARFFPTPGQLAPHIERLMAMRRVLARRARETLARIEAEGA